MCGKGRSRGKRRACGPAPFHTEHRSIRSSRPAQRLPPTADHHTIQLLIPHPLLCLSLLLINSPHCRRNGTFHPFPPMNDVTCRCCRPYPPDESRARLSQLPVQMSTLLFRQEMIGLQDNFLLMLLHRPPRSRCHIPRHGRCFSHRRSLTVICARRTNLAFR